MGRTSTREHFFLLTTQKSFRKKAYVLIARENGNTGTLVNKMKTKRKSCVLSARKYGSLDIFAIEGTLQRKTCATSAKRIRNQDIYAGKEAELIISKQYPMKG